MSSEGEDRPTLRENLIRQGVPPEEIKRIYRTMRERGYGEEEARIAAERGEACDQDVGEEAGMTAVRVEVWVEDGHLCADRTRSEGGKQSDQLVLAETAGEATQWAQKQLDLAAVDGRGGGSARVAPGAVRE